MFAEAEATNYIHGTIFDVTTKQFQNRKGEAMKKLGAILTNMFFVMFSYGAMAESVVGCWSFKDPEQNGKYALVLPDNSEITLEDLKKYITEDGVFVIKDSHYSRSLRAHRISIKAENAKYRRLLLQRLAEEKLAKLPDYILINCDATLKIVP